MNLNEDQAKILAMFVLGGGSFVVGMIPAMINRRFQDRHKLTITFLLCFGAGVLMATAIVHILTEVQEIIPDSAAIYFCGGFFLMYIVDVFFHFLFDGTPGHSHSAAESTRRVSGYGAVGSHDESGALLGPSAGTSDHVEGGGAVQAPTERNGPCPSRNSSSKFGLLCALSLHSFLEGLAIGVQDTGAKVLLLITAVACHKYVVGFCLGLEVSAGHSNRHIMLRTLFISMVIFALGSIMGIAIGMALVDYKQLWSSATIPILQAVAGGTLLYVTLSEVLPREKAKYHQRSKWASVIQFVACLLGFTMMAILNSYLGE